MQIQFLAFIPSNDPIAIPAIVRATIAYQDLVCDCRHPIGVTVDSVTDDNGQSIPLDAAQTRYVRDCVWQRVFDNLND